MYAAIIFGSATRTSMCNDIDLLFVTDNPKQDQNDYAMIKEKFRQEFIKEVDCFPFILEEFQGFLKGRNPIICSALGSGIQICGSLDLESTL